MNLIFRPQEFSGSYKLSSHKSGDFVGVYHKHRRGNYHPNEPLNQTSIGRIFGKIHYLTSHAPNAVQLKWKQADIRWQRKFPVKSSCTYANTYSVHRFL